MARSTSRGNSPRIFFRFFGWNWYHFGDGGMTRKVGRMTYRPYGLYH